MKKSILTEQEIFECWNYDEWDGYYWTDDNNDNYMTYLPDEKELIINSGSNNEYVTTIEAYNSDIKKSLEGIAKQYNNLESKPLEINGNKLDDYETYNYIYMNFKVDNEGIWGLPEGVKTIHLFDQVRLNSYRHFLVSAIAYNEKYINDYNFPECAKKFKKYSLYLKRLDNAINKFNSIYKEYAI